MDSAVYIHLDLPLVVLKEVNLYFLVSLQTAAVEAEQTVRLLEMVVPAVVAAVHAKQVVQD